MSKGQETAVPDWATPFCWHCRRDKVWTGANWECPVRAAAFERWLLELRGPRRKETADETP